MKFSAKMKVSASKSATSPSCKTIPDYGFTKFSISYVAVGNNLADKVVDNHLPKIFVYGGEIKDGKFYLYVLLSGLYSGNGYGNTYDFNDNYKLESLGKTNYYGIGKIVNSSLGTGTLGSDKANYCIKIEYDKIPDLNGMYNFEIFEVHNSGISVTAISQKTNGFYLMPNIGHFENKKEMFINCPEISKSVYAKKNSSNSDFEIVSNSNAEIKITPTSNEYPNQFSIYTKDNEKSIDNDYHSSITDNLGQKEEFANSLKDNAFYPYGLSENYPMTIYISYLSYKGTWVSATIKAYKGLRIEVTPNN